MGGCLAEIPAGVDLPPRASACIDPKAKRFIAADATLMVSGKVKKKKGVIEGGETANLPGVNANALLIVERRG